MAIAATTGFTNLVTPALRKVFQDTIADIPKEFRQIFNVINAIPKSQAGGPAGGKFFDDLQVSSLGTLGQKPEGNAITYDIPVEGNTVRYEPFTFGMGFRITEELQEDELYGVMAKMAKELSLAAMHQMEVQAARILTNGFTTTSGTGHTAGGFDSLALFSASHVRLRGGTRANKAGTDLDLSVTALEQALDLFEGWTNHSAMPTPKKAALLIHPYQLKWLARQILETDLAPFTGDNEVNSLGGEGLRSFMYHYLTDADSWFITAPKAQHDLNVWIRRAPDFSVGDDFDTGDSKAKATFRMATGHGEPDGTFGSEGA